MRGLHRIIFMLLGCMAAPAVAHIVIAERQAQAGSYHVAAFRVSHGCGASPTISLTVQIPAGVNVAKPQPKPGWIMRVERVPLAKPIPSEGGGQQVDRVASISWMGRLDPGQFDEFGVLLKLPSAPGTLYFPTIQRCDQGDAAWTTIPAKGQPWSAVKQPAPMLEVRTGGAPHH